ncbi:hypothetical protein [Niameybacter sp.]|uniref:hypothetical protein n=1 Tax=Niameybacter sp. TaxID=2033640 RepID=UPI002FC64539
MRHKEENNQEIGYILKKAVSVEGVLCLIFTFGGLFLLSQKMGVANMFNTILNTAYDLLMGTVFGMGLMITVFMIGIKGIDQHLGLAVFIGNVGAIIGSMISTKLMMHYTKKHYGTKDWCLLFVPLY